MLSSIELKACGLLPQVTLKQLKNVSLAPQQIKDYEHNQKYFCLHPDESDDELADKDPKVIHQYFSPVYSYEECDILHNMHSRYRNAEKATGRGSWPPGKGCHPNEYPHENYHATLVWIDFDAFMSNNTINREVTDEEWQKTIVDAKVWPNLENPVKTVEECKQVFSYGGERVRSHDRPEWRERSNKKVGDTFTMFDMSTWLVLEGARRVGCLYLEVFDGPNGNHNVHEKMIPIPGSTAGYAYFNNATCGDHVTSNIDSLLSYSLGRLTALRQHEFGHTKNLPHEFREPQSRHRSVMSYAFISAPYQGYRKSGPPYQYVADHSWSRLIRFFGDEAAKPINEPTNPPPTGNNPEILPGVFTVNEFEPNRFEVLGEMALEDGFEIEGDAHYIMTLKLDRTGYVLKLKPPT